LEHGARSLQVGEVGAARIASSEVCAHGSEISGGKTAVKIARQEVAYVRAAVYVVVFVIDVHSVPFYAIKCDERFLAYLHFINVAYEQIVPPMMSLRKGGCRVRADSRAYGHVRG